MRAQLRCRAWFFSPIVIVMAAFPIGTPGSAPPLDSSAAEVERLIAQLDDDTFQVREAATAALKRLGAAAEPALRRALAQSPSPEVRFRARTILREVAVHFVGQSRGWYWVYGSICHGQTFRATGRKIESLELRVARLNDTPAAPLEVEIRDPRLKHLHARGRIITSEAQRSFAWRQVRWHNRSSLETGQEYILFFHSQKTSNSAPWIINAIYADLYPHGRHLGYEDDFFFRLSSDRGNPLHVGPDRETGESLPINIGAAGGAEAEGPLVLVGYGMVPPAKDVAEPPR
jgi:hypothetical protein